MSKFKKKQIGSTYTHFFHIYTVYIYLALLSGEHGDRLRQDALLSLKSLSVLNYQIGRPLVSS